MVIKRENHKNIQKIKKNNKKICKSQGCIALEARPRPRGLSRAKFCGLGLEGLGLGLEGPGLGLEGLASSRPRRQ